MGPKTNKQKKPMIFLKIIHEYNLKLLLLNTRVKIAKNRKMNTTKQLFNKDVH